MIILDDIRAATLESPHVVLTVGSFDGVHLGHRQILDKVVAEARVRGGTPTVLTMRPHPREFFTPDSAPNLLTTHEKKLELFEALGIEVVCTLPFCAEVADMTPLAFIEEILHRRCRAEVLIVGHDFRFGKRAAGDYDLLRNVAPTFHLTVARVEPLLVAGERVSSTLVRECVLQGDLARAELLLGRRYSIVGEVVAGRGIGVSLGFPTANIQPHHSAVPAQGVYAAEAILDGVRRPAAVNIGIAPTIRHEDTTIEAHILDFHGNIAGAAIEVVFHNRLRPEKRFPSREALVAQIAEDVTAIREYFTQADLAQRSSRS